MCSIANLIAASVAVPRPSLPGAMNHVDVGQGFSKLVGDLARAVGRVVVDDQDRAAGRELPDGFHQRPQIARFVVRRQRNQKLLASADDCADCRARSGQPRLEHRQRADRTPRRPDRIAAQRVREAQEMIGLRSDRAIASHARSVESGDRVVEKQVPPPEAPARNDFSIVWARSTAVAVPPGKRNGWEHQDLRRRHLLVSENTKTSPARRSAPWQGRQESIRRRNGDFISCFLTVFSCRDPCGVPAPIRRAGTISVRLLRLAEASEKLAVRGKLVLALGSDAPRRSPQLAEAVLPARLR